MKCNKCGNELKASDKFCTKCGTSIINNEEIENSRNIKSNIGNTIKGKFRSNSKSVITLLFIIILIILSTIIYNVIKQKNNTRYIKTESHNGYKTFDFTVDEILETYSVKSSDFHTYKTSPYCKEHTGTTQGYFWCNDSNSYENYSSEKEKYVYQASIVYEDKSKKVISIELSTNTFSRMDIRRDYNLSSNEDTFTIEKDSVYEYMATLLARIGSPWQWLIEMSTPQNAKAISTTESKVLAGKYKFHKNIGLVEYMDRVTYGAVLTIMATEEKDFYNLSIESLMNRLSDNFFIKTDIDVNSFMQSTQNFENNYNTINSLDTNNQTNNSSSLTGIEQAIKDRAFEVTDDLSESKLKAAFTDGSLQYYYDNWEKCLEDAQKLNIITSDKPYLTMEEELEQQYYNEQNYNNQSYNREDNSVSNEQPILVKSYNTIKKEDSSDYHIIKIYKYSNGEYSYETDWYTYGSIIPSITSDRQYKTLDEALTSAIQNFREFPLTISDLTEE